MSPGAIPGPNRTAESISKSASPGALQPDSPKIQHPDFRQIAPSQARSSHPPAPPTPKNHKTNKIEPKYSLKYFALNYPLLAHNRNGRRMQRRQPSNGPAKLSSRHPRKPGRTPAVSSPARGSMGDLILCFFALFLIQKRVPPTPPLPSGRHFLTGACL